MWRERCSVHGGRLTDDGKHASSVIEVENSLLEAKLEGGVEGDVLGMPWGGCGFKRFGVTCSTKMRLFFIYPLLNHFEAVFFVPLAFLGSFWVHFGIILKSFLLTFSSKSLFITMCFVCTKPHFLR